MEKFQNLWLVSLVGEILLAPGQNAFTGCTSVDHAYRAWLYDGTNIIRGVIITYYELDEESFNEDKFIVIGKLNAFELGWMTDYTAILTEKKLVWFADDGEPLPLSDRTIQAALAEAEWPQPHKIEPFQEVDYA